MQYNTRQWKHKQINLSTVREPSDMKQNTYIQTYIVLSIQPMLTGHYKVSDDETNSQNDNKKPCCCKEIVRCSVFLPSPNDSLNVTDVHCIKADLNVKL